MLRAHAVVDAVEPGLQIGEDEVDHRHELFGNFGVAAFGNWMVVVAPLAQAGIAVPIVSDDQRAWHDGILNKATQGICAAVSGDGQSHSTGIAAILPLILCRARLPVANLDSCGHQRFVVDAPAFAARPSADPCLIDLDMLFRPTTDTVLVRPHHARAQFVQDAEGGFISCQPKLPLKLHRRHPRRLAGDEVRGPEPNAERRMTAFHDGADQEAGLAATRTALQNTGSADNAEGLGDLAAMRADKAVRPTGTPKIGSTCRVIGKQLLKLWGKARSSRWWMSMAAMMANASPGGCMRQPDRHAADLGLEVLRLEYKNDKDLREQNTNFLERVQASDIVETYDRLSALQSNLRDVLTGSK